jgi:hypothetical protein
VIVYVGLIAVVLLPGTHVVPLGVVKEQVEISGHIAEFSQEHSHLAAVMDSVIGAVLHQLT